MNFDEGLNKNDLLTNIKKAINQCDTLEEPQKSISKTILESLMFIIEGKKINVNEFKHDEIVDKNVTEPVLKLSKELKISVEDIEDVFEFDNEIIELNAGFEGESWIQRQFKSTLCILTAYSICYNITEISSQDLIEQLESLGIESIPNLSPNLQKTQFNKYIKVLGGKNALKTYKIKKFGIKKGKELINELISAEKETL